MLKLKDNVGTASPGWRTALDGLVAKDIFATATVLYLEKWDDGAVAAELTSRTGKQVSAEMSKAIRVDAAVEALVSGDAALRREWMYRYRVLTPRTLVKEYMFLTGIPAFFEAKVELADELFWLSRDNSIDELTEAFNAAMGRKNISSDLLCEFLAYRTVMLDVKQHINKRATATRSDAVEMLDSLAAKVFDSYSKFGNNIVVAARKVEAVLELPRGSMTPEMTRCLMEYHVLLEYPEMTDGDSLRRIIAEDDVFSSIDEVVYGDPEVLTVEQMPSLFAAMNASPVLAPRHLSRIKRVAGRLAAQDTSPEKNSEKVRRMAEKHDRLDDVNPLLPTKIDTVVKTKRITSPELKKTLALVNTVSTIDEVVEFMKDQVVAESERPALGDFMSKYCFARFGINVLPAVINGPPVQ